MVRIRKVNKKKPDFLKYERKPKNNIPEQIGILYPFN